MDFDDAEASTMDVGQAGAHHDGHGLGRFRRHRDTDLGAVDVDVHRNRAVTVLHAIRDELRQHQLSVGEPPRVLGRELP